MLTTALIEQTLAALSGATVGLVGDLFLDRYFDIDPALDEPSVETGLTAYQVTRVRAYPGALGTVLNNLAALGVGRIVPIAILGDDGEGYELQQALLRLPAVDLGRLVVAPDRRTPTYAKPMRGGIELHRLDTKNRTPTPPAHETVVLNHLNDAWPQFDALIVLDQVSEIECGVVTARVRERIAEIGAAKPGKFILADSREQIGRFRNVCLKPNFRECFPNGVGPEAGIDLMEGGWARQRNCGRIVFCTHGEHGTYVFREGGPALNLIPGFPATGPIDVCGAGDSCSAGITAGMLAGLAPDDAAAFGNLVASITVQQIGTTGIATPAQVRARWAEVCRA